MFYIYAYLRTDDLTPYYIGKGCGNRAWSNDHLVIVPKDKSRIVILETELSDLGALALERRMIEWYGRKDLGTGILRNRTDGGEGCSGVIPWNKGKQIGSFITEEGRAKVSKANKGIAKNHGAKVSKALKGKSKSEEHKRRLSEAGKGNIPWNTGLTKENNEIVKKQSESLKGRLVSDETKIKQSLAHKGTVLTDEHKLKIGAANKGKILSEETKQRMSESRKKYWEEKRLNGKR